jgi:hypothetical protein
VTYAALHWDGKQWTQVSEDDSGLVHYSGGTWTSEPAPSETGYTTQVSGRPGCRPRTSPDPG